MPASILTTRLYVPPPPPRGVSRPALIDRLNKGLHRKLTLISAPAGFGKTTLVSAWIAEGQLPVAWVSLDADDSDPARFLSYVISALQTCVPDLGAGLLRMLQAPQLPPLETLLTALVNEMATLPERIMLVLDDYHVLESQAVDTALTFLIKHQPPHLHLVIATREDPPLPLAQLRVRGQLTELRVADLRFTEAEAAAFLNQVMGLNLSSADIHALETRTEGWIAGLQLAAISMQGQVDTSSFIQSFTGSHHFIMDYLVEEVLHQQSHEVQLFLLYTAILDRLCGALCDAVLQAEHGQATLAYLERANLFLIPLDNERRWYRYHHLFAELLRQRLQQHLAPAEIADLHRRASAWYQAQGLEIEAFRHAAAAPDYALAERLIEGGGMPLHFRGAERLILNWLETLPETVFQAWPELLTVYASVLLVTGQGTRIEPVLQTAEAAFASREPDERTRDLIGRIAATRATAATNQNQVEAIIEHSNRALAYLHPQNMAFRTSTIWKLGFAHQLQGDRAAAKRAFQEVITTGQATRNVVFTLLATINMGLLQENDTYLGLAAETYQRVLALLGEPPLPFASEPHLGLARIHYEWDNLETAQYHVQRAIQLARQMQNNDRFIACEIFLARFKLAQGDVTGAATALANADYFVRQGNFAYRIPDVMAMQVITLLHQGNVTAAAQLAQAHDLPLSQARVKMAQGDMSTALVLLTAWREQVEAKGWADEKLKVMLLQALALHALDEKDQAIRVIAEALALAEPGGYIRLFVDEGAPMATLLTATTAQGIMPTYTRKLLTFLQAVDQPAAASSSLIEPLSQRELEVLHLIAQGLSNQEIGARLFLALDTVKGHNRKIFEKMQVQRRTEAVARARELGLL